MTMDVDSYFADSWLPLDFCFCLLTSNLGGFGREIYIFRYFNLFETRLCWGMVGIRFLMLPVTVSW